MHAFQYALESFLVLITIASDYLLLFDQWIITAPRPRDLSFVSRSQISWIKALKTAIAYAIMEPVLYATITSVSSLAMWWLLMTSYIHLVTVPGTVFYMAEILKKQIEDHRNVCIGAQSTEDEYRDHDDLTTSAPLEMTQGSIARFSPSARLTAELQADEARSSTPSTCTAHKPGPLVQLATLLPVTTAAATNASLLFYTRYLSTKDSQEWLERFTFGWTAVLLTSIICLGISKAMNNLMHLACNRPWIPTNRGEVLQRLVCWAVLFVVRALVRWPLGQEVLTLPQMGRNGTVLVLPQDSWVGEGVADGGESKHAFDRGLSSIPQWLATTISTLNVVGWSGYFAWTWYQRQRKRRAEAASL